MTGNHDRKQRMRQCFVEIPHSGIDIAQIIRNLRWFRGNSGARFTVDDQRVTSMKQEIPPPKTRI